MTNDEAKDILEEYKRRQGRKQMLQKAPDSLLDFITYCKDDYVVSWHHKALCDRLSRLKDERSKRLIISVPPQRGKSEIVSRKLGIWWLGNFPDAKIIMASYAAELANSFNKDAQHTVSTDAYKAIFPDIVTGHTDRNLVLRNNQMQTGQGGQLYSVGVGGTTTGKSAGSVGKNASSGLFIIDDPTKDLTEAFSEVHREKVKSWYQAVVSTRIHGGSHIIVMHTRWHADDLTGWLLERDKDKTWEVLSFPELGYDPDYKNEYDPRTSLEDPLWPSEKGNYDDLMKVKADVGEYVWSALFMNKPRIAGGNIIKDHWIKYYTNLPAGLETNKLRSSAFIQGWDLTFKETTKGSFVVGATFIVSGANFYLVDFYRKRADIIETQRAITEMSVNWPKCRTVLIEEKANGSGILALLKNKVSGLIPVLPQGTKDERLVMVAPLFEAGNVYLPANATYTRTIVEELTTFPSAPNDDIVDCFSMILDRNSGLKGVRHLQAMAKGY